MSDLSIPMNNVSYPLCDNYGFTSKQREVRVAMMGLSNVNHSQVKYLHEKVIQPYAKSIVDTFYEILFSFPEIKAYLLSLVNIEHLKMQQLAYLETYGLNFDTPEYFEQRLKVGQVHAKIGLPLSYYQMSFRVLDETIINYLVMHTTNNEGTILQYVKLISNLSALDMSLAIETYHGKKIHDMSDSIHALMDEHESLVIKMDLDELTMAASRARILDYVKNNVLKAEERGSPFCVAMIDIDFFKSVNDEYGHIIGDHILTEVAARIMGALRTDDMLGRYGGEEFVLVLPGSDIKVAKKITERVCKRVNNKPFKVDEHIISVTISIGVTQSNKKDSDEILIARADHALYEAKHKGRNQVISI